MTELKSVDYLQIFLSPPKLFIFLYLLAFLSCPVTLYTTVVWPVHIVFFMSVLPSGPSHLLSVRHILRGKPSLKKKNQCTLLSWNCIYDLNRWLQFNFIVWPYHSLWLPFSSFQFFSSNARILFKIPSSNFAQRYVYQVLVRDIQLCRNFQTLVLLLYLKF